MTDIVIFSLAWEYKRSTTSEKNDKMGEVFVTNQGLISDVL